MQPFDRGVFDKRFDDVLAPAVRGAGLDPYRVDRDPSAAIPIDQIESGIRDSSVCLAEITVDNPNVWFELGYAIACGKEVVLVCSSERKTKFPFDIQHRHVISYVPESPRDFQRLGTQITERLLAALKKERQLAHLSSSPVAERAGLEPHEITALVAIVESGLDPDSPPSGFAIKSDMEKAGYTEIAAVLGVKRLIQIGLVEVTLAETYNGEQYTGYVATDEGMRWLMQNQRQVLLRRPDKRTSTHDDFPF